jgi:hypothetical protein
LLNEFRFVFPGVSLARQYDGVLINPKSTLTELIEKIKYFPNEVFAHELYVGCVKVIILRIEGDIRDINKALSSENIRVDRESVSETTVTYRVIFRGQISNVKITKEDARTEIGERLSGYIRNLVFELTQKSANS